MQGVRKVQELESRRLYVELKKIVGRSGLRVVEKYNIFGMTKRFQTFKVERTWDLVKLMRACKNSHFAQESWPRRLLGVLSCEAAGVGARLSVEDSDDYAKVNRCLLNRSCPLAEEFRQKFTSAVKYSNGSCAEFTYQLRFYLLEWLKAAKSYGDRKNMVDTS